LKKKTQTKNNSKKSTKKISLIVSSITSSEIFQLTWRFRLTSPMSAEAEAAPSGASSTNGTPQRADLDELLAQAELINDDELVEQLRAKKVRVKLAKKKKKKKKTNFHPLSHSEICQCFKARRDAKLLEAVTIKADLQAKSDRLHQAINQRAADEAAAAAADVRNEIYILINHTQF
jgi:hypothetical protein